MPVFMLRITPIRNSTNSRYRSYLMDESFDEPRWFGKGAKSLGLSDEVEESSLREVLEAQLISTNSTGNPRLGFDLCFSADKTLSLLGLVGGSQDIIKAHQEAVKDSLHKVEDEIIQVRASVGGSRKIFYPENIVAAQFHHATSRRLDPNIHTHVLIKNATSWAGKWRAVLENNLFSQLHKLTDFYHKSLKEKIEALGLKTEVFKERYTRIVGYSDRQISAFSQGRNEIEAIVGKEADSKTSHAIGLRIRPPKSDLRAEDLTSEWKEKATSLGVVHPAPGLDLEPDYLEADHYDELVKESGIDPELARLNFESISGNQVLERLLHERIPEGGESSQWWTGDVKKAFRWLDKTGVTSRGFWAKGGFDAQNLKEKVLWGSYKADKKFRRFDHKKGKLVKYEHPFKTPRRLFLLDVPKELGDRLLMAHGITSNEGETFWETVKREKLPITITEGAKKTACLLSNGEIAIGVSGVNGVYRNTEDGRLLNEDIKVFADGRKITFAYDQDSKLETKHKVLLALVRGAELIEQKESPVTVKQWHWKAGKGVDDLIVKNGAIAYKDAPEKPLNEVTGMVYQRRYNKLLAQVKRHATPGNERVGVAYLAINDGGLREAIKILNRDPEIKVLDQEGKKTAITQALKNLHEKFILEDSKQAEPTFQQDFEL